MSQGEAIVANEDDGLSRWVKTGIYSESPFDVHRSVAMRSEQPFWALTSSVYSSFRT